MRRRIVIRHKASIMQSMFDLAIEMAKPTFDADPRNFWLGAAGKRRDGTIVCSRNGAVHTTSTNYRVLPQAHAEVRLCRKLGHGGIVYVVRIARKDRSLVMARPCRVCRSFLKAHNVERVYYSINNFQYGIWFPVADRDIVSEI